MDNKIIDLLIIGGGPAGLTAAIYARRAGLSTEVVEKFFSGGQLLKASTIENYPGFPDGILACDLADNMHKHAEKFGAQFTNDEVVSIEKLEDANKGQIFEIKLNKQIISAKSIIIATGRRPRELGLADESKFIGSGICYCAHCDGHFFRDKVVAVVGGGNTAVDDAIYLSAICEKVILIHRREEFRAEKILFERLNKIENIEQVLNARITKLEGKNALESITLEINKASGIRSEQIHISGLFVAIGYIPSTEFLKGTVDLDNLGYVTVNQDLKTSVDGIFAAGDVVNKKLQQIITSASDGALAANAVLEYLNRK